MIHMSREAGYGKLGLVYEINNCILYFLIYPLHFHSQVHHYQDLTSEGNKQMYCGSGKKKSPTNYLIILPSDLNQQYY